MKVIIEDLAASFGGDSEKELPTDTAIRFEFGGTSLTCKLTEEGLEINKRNDTREGSTIWLRPVVSNEIVVK